MGAGADPNLDAFEALLTPQESRLLSTLNSPARIQAFLNNLPYSEDDIDRCPVRLLHDRKGNSFDGGLFAALALRRLGRPPMLLQFVPKDGENRHLIALFRDYGGWGAVAHSNLTGLRYRDPVFLSQRELVMSYFDNHVNLAGEKTLRGYRGPFLMKLFDGLNWMGSDDGLKVFQAAMDHHQVHTILNENMAANLSLADERSLEAALLGAHPIEPIKIPTEPNELE
jgi:hypothetical protein